MPERFYIFELYNWKIMITTVYQKFASRYATIFTLINITDGKDFNQSEIIPSDKISKMSEDEFDELFNELMDSANEKASWSDGGEEPFDEEDARAEYHQKWDAINSAMDEIGL